MNTQSKTQNIIYPDSIDDNGAADEERDGDEGVNEKEATAPGSTLVQSVSRLMLLTPRRLRRTYAAEYSWFQIV